MPRTSALLLLALVLAGAGWLRFSSLDFGEGRIGARPDEDTVPLTLRGLEQGVLMPPLVIYGGGYFHPLRAFISAFDAIAPAPEDHRGRLTGHREVHAARWWSALLSWLTVAVTYVVGTRIGGNRVGLVAALILATSTLATREAHFGKADTSAAFAATVFLWAATRRFASETARAVAVAAAVAYALSNKGSVGVIPAAAYTLLLPTEPSGAPGVIPWRRVLGAGAASVGFFLLLNPHWVTDSIETLEYSRRLASAVADNSWLVGHEQAPGPLAYHVGISLRYGAGLMATLLALPALAYGLYHGRCARVVVLTCASFWAVFMTSPMVLARFVLPILPGLAILIALLLVAATELRPLHRRAGVVLAVLALLVVQEPTRTSIQLVRLLGQTDTRLLAANWMDTNIPQTARVLSWGAPARINRDWGEAPVPSGRALRNVPPERWAERGVEYVVVHQYPLAYSSVPPPARLAALEPLVVFDPFDEGETNAPVLEAMDAFYLPIGRLQGVVRPGPRIAIYRVADGRTDP